MGQAAQLIKGTQAGPVRRGAARVTLACLAAVGGQT